MIEADQFDLFQLDATARSHMQRMVDFAQAKTTRDAAISQVAENADAVWLEEAERALRQYLERSREFFVDDFWRDTGLRAPRESRALGAVVRGAARRGWMVKSGRSRPSVRSHLSDKPVWESRIYKEAA